MQITHDRLKAILKYEPETGLWFSINDNKSIKFHYVQNYPVSYIDGEPYYLHRLAWFYMTGEWPMIEIDHEDTNKSNNKWTNLREATRQENGRNCKVRKHSKSGIKWVYKKPNGQYRVTLTVDKKKVEVGTFSTAEEASAAAIARAEQIHQQFMYKFLK